MTKAGLASLYLVAALVVLLVSPAACVESLAAASMPSGTTVQAEAQGSGASVKRAVDYLKGRQLSDGGFAEPGRSSSEQLTMWVVCGLASVGQDVGSWRKGGKSPIEFLAAGASKLEMLTDVEKGCLAVCCAGGNPRSFGGRDLVAQIKSRMAPDGRIGGLVNEHCWGIIALKAAGETVPDGARAWLAANQNLDGGFGYGAGTGSDPDNTGAALQALIAAGEDPAGSAVKRAISYLHFCQAPDAGFTYNADQSNVASTAWAVQGIVAAGQDPGGPDWTRSGKTPLDYMASTQQSDGHFRYMKSSDANAAWMTAEALPAISGKAYPLRPEAAPTRTTTPPSNTAGNVTRGADEGETVRGDSDPGETAEGAALSSDGEAFTGKRALSGGRGSVRGDGARTLARGVDPRGGAGAAGAGSNNLVVFCIFCGLYLVVLGLAYVSLSYYFTARGTAP